MHTWSPEEEQLVETELLRITNSLLPVISPAALHTRLAAGGSLDLFNGTAGVIVFFLRLYEHYRLPLYLKACRSAADILVQHPAALRPEYYTLYTGATSLLYLCIKMYEATGEEKYLERALQLLEHFEPGIPDHVVQDDFISGHAGNIFVLSYLHAHTKHGALPPLIRRLTDKMIHHARIAPQGLRWGHIKRSFDCLTGFSHGASGIGYALLQAAQYFRDDGLQYLAEQALTYEMSHYNKAANNWLDLRLTSTRLPAEDILDWQPAVFTKYASDINSWAHGAAGISIARLYAWQVTGQDSYLQQAQLALQRSLHDLQQLKRGDFTLCSGYGGIAVALLQAADILHQPELRQAARQLALAAVRYYQHYGTYNSYVPGNVNDPGLFSGMAGVGYFLLSALSPACTDAITHPMICSTQHHTTPLYDPGEVKMLLFSRYYKTTISLLQQQGMLNIAGADDIHALDILLQQQVTALPAADRSGIQESYTFERCIASLWQQHRGMLYYTEHKALLQAAAHELLNAPPDRLLQAILLPAANIRLCNAYLCCNHEQGISTFPIGRLTATVLDNLAPGKTLQALIQQILDTHFKDVANNTRQQISQAIITQARSLLEQCFITTIPHK